MSEFTDYMLYRTAAPTLDGLARDVLGHVGAASVPLYELGDAALKPDPARDAAWSALPKPSWIIVGTPRFSLGEGMRDDWIHLLVEEDFRSWGFAMVLAGTDHVINVMAEGRPYREATLQYGDGAVWPDAETKASLGPLAAAIGVSEADLSATFVPDGGQAFSDLIGAHYEQMEQLNDPSPALPNGEAILGA
ncbi:hypothetical protein [Jannaschia marina]|uniref:hypothetical protein n=1 Tax=Jannaschia marina TaxID=2741674 RepID=UPI0015C8EF0A|nr:hypothetical protein [Jannaschia marina]